MALAILGWLWIREPAPPPVRPEPVAPRVGTPSPPKAETPEAPSPPKESPKPTVVAAEPPAPAPVVPTPAPKVEEASPKPQPVTNTSPTVASATNDLSVGAAHPLGTIVVRSNRPSASLSTNSSVAESFPVDVPASGQVRNILEAQLALARLGFSSGSLDGKLGSQTRAAFRAFQEREGLPTTGNLDAATRNRLVLGVEPFTSYTVAEADLTRLRPLAKTWLGKSEQDRLEYETILELVSEKFHSHPGLIRQLNPVVDWDHIQAGVPVRVPNIEPLSSPGRLAFVRIQLGAKTLQGFAADSRLVLHFPCSIAKDKEKRPVGELHVEKIAVNPNYTFNPEVFPESEEARQIKRKLILQPGPNNPVGVAWISLDRPGYGIHGTPQPEQVGRTESHGCFRLANWNAELLVKSVWIGMPIQVEP